MSEICMYILQRDKWLAIPSARTPARSIHCSVISQLRVPVEFKFCDDIIVLLTLELQ